ncbi:DNA-binding protein [Microbacterium foliorum]|nr:DNA-binding protein [Microbacterium foliorum]
MVRQTTCMSPIDGRTDPVLTTKQAAEYVGLRPQTMRLLKHAGEGSVVLKHGRLNACYPADLDAWLKERLS